MSKRPRKRDRQSSTGRGASATDKSPEPNASRDSTRETVEAIVVAFVLAFLFKTFEAEAFVIPTGSMAPTLNGRHKDICCEQCRFEYTVGASDELNRETSLLESRLVSAVCPNCRFLNNVYDAPVFKGDRILVTKSPFEPQRFDVVVFKYPEEPQINYIKRLVGLPGETIRFEGGDLYARREPSDPDGFPAWQILRKDDPNKQRVLQLPVYDDRFAPTRLLEAGWPERWAPVRRRQTADAVAGWSEHDAGWQADRARRHYTIDPNSAAGADVQWLRYRHYVPDQDDWQALLNERGPANLAEPKLIADFCGYNTVATVPWNARPGIFGNTVPRRGAYWVGDLTLNCSIDIIQAGENGEILLELVEGERWNRCRINVSTGEARLTWVDRRIFRREDFEEETIATATTDLKGTGEYEITFANVDDRLSLWIDDDLVTFGAAGSYQADQSMIPSEADLSPVGIATRGIVATLSDLVIQRDIYYRADVADPGASPADTRVSMKTVNEIGRGNGNTLYDLASLLNTPTAWYNSWSSAVARKKRDYMRHGDISTLTLEDDEYLMLGDNSPKSQDSRLFTYNHRYERGDLSTQRHAVAKSAVIGKAFFIYWPHGVPFLNEGNGWGVWGHRAQGHRRGAKRHTVDYPSLRVPFYPQVNRMHRIR